MTTTTDPWPHLLAMVQQQYGSPQRKWAKPGDLAQAMDKRIVQTPALELIDQELVRLADTPDGRLLLQLGPQEGKSQRCSRWFPLWVLTQNPDTRIGIVSYEHGVARRWGRAIRDDIIMHPELGLRIRDDLAAQHEWQLAGHEGGVYTAGIGAALTGRPLEMLIIDDPLKDREQADSAVYRERVYSWWTDVGATRLAPGAPVVQIATRWHESDLAGQLLAAEDGHLWRNLNIPAQADHDPNKGETDILGREPGEYLESARGRTTKQWEAIKVRSGARTWASLYQGRPSAAEGDMLKRDWWQEYDQPLWIQRDDGSVVVTAPDAEIIQSWDLAFKDTATSDYVVGQVWCRIGATCYLLDQVRGRFDFVETCNQVKRLTAKWPQALLKLVEDKANGPAVIAALNQTVMGIVPEQPIGSKSARVSAVTPLIEARNVYLPSAEIAPWIGEFIEECAAFPNGAHDDQCLIGSTAIETPTGMTRLDAVNVGDIVRGQSGWVTVSQAGMTSPSAEVITRGELIGTPKHPVWTPDGWTPLFRLSAYDEVWIRAGTRDAIAPLITLNTDGAGGATNVGGSYRNHGPSAHPLSRKKASASAQGVASESPPEAIPACAAPAGCGAATFRLKRSNTEVSRSGDTQPLAKEPTGTTTSPAADSQQTGWNHFTARSTKISTVPSLTGGKFTTLTPPIMPPQTWRHFHQDSTWKSRSPGGLPVGDRGGIETRCLQISTGSDPLPQSGIDPMRGAHGIGSMPRVHCPVFAPVFNLTTSDGTYFANGVLVHNCDAMSQALNRMMLMPILDADQIFEDVEAEFYETQGWSISPV